MMRDDAAELSAAALAELVVFPLPRVVFFPHTRLPLRIFEPRYRAMMADCLTRRPRIMAVVQLQPGWQADYQGEPPIYSVAGVGMIENVRHHADDTYDFELLGLQRVRLEELPMQGKPYRRARATPLVDDVPKENLSSSEVSALFSLAAGLSMQVKERQPRFRLLAQAEDAAHVLVDRLADQFVGDPELRQQLLELADVGERLRLVSSTLAQLHLTLGASNRGASTLH
jgi:Lon protease-like protein